MAGPITIKITNENLTGIDGNDFAIDDLVFAPIVEDEVIVVVNEKRNNFV